MKHYLLPFLLFTALCPGQTSPPGHFAFYRDEVHEIRLRFAQTDWWDKLTTNFTDNTDVPYLEASMSWGPFSYATVGVRFKGNSSYNGASTKKKPFRIKLNEFVKGQKILGMGSFNLSNGWSDPTLIREKVYDDIATSAGIVGPRANFAALYINDQYWGLYTLGEIVNSDFLTNYFGKNNDTGNLYKAQENATLEDRGDDPAPYKQMFEKQSNEDKDDWSDIVQLAQILNRTSADQLPAKLEQILDIDSVLTALAMDNLTANVDNYAGFLAQNYYLYRRPVDNKFVFIRWDPSLAFGALSMGGDPKTLALDWTQASSTQAFPGGGQGLPPGVTPPTGFPGGQPPAGFPGGQPPAGAGPGSSTARPLALKIWAIPQYKLRYNQIYRWLANYITTAEVTAHMTALHTMLGPWVQKETQGLSSYQDFVDNLTKDVAASLGRGGDTPPPGGNPPPDGVVPPVGFPGGGAGGGFGSAATPGLIPFFESRIEWVRTQLKSLP